MTREIYLDNAAAMMPDADILQFYSEVSGKYYANAEAVHSLAYRSRKALDSAGENLSQLLFGHPGYPVIWGESATELFRVISSFDQFRSSAASMLEHPALIANLRTHTAFVPLPVDAAGAIIPETDIAGVDLLAQYQVQSELGMIPETAVWKSSAAAFRLVDAVQAAGRIPLCREADGWSISGGKFAAPGGAALLLAPGGRYTGALLAHAQNLRHQEYAVSRVNVPLMLTMVRALEKAVSLREENYRRISALNALARRGAAELGILPTLPDGVKTSPYILNMLLPAQESAVVVRALSSSGIFIASGSACSAESGKPSPALTALKFRREKAYRAIRVSFGFANREEEVEIFLAELKNVLKNY